MIYDHNHYKDLIDLITIIRSLGIIEDQTYFNTKDTYIQSDYSYEYQLWMFPTILNIFLIFET